MTICNPRRTFAHFCSPVVVADIRHSGFQAQPVPSNGFSSSDHGKTKRRELGIGHCLLPYDVIIETPPASPWREERLNLCESRGFD